MGKVLENLEPVTPIQIKCANAEQALGQAVMAYFDALQDDLIERGSDQEGAFRTAINAAIESCATNVFTLLLSYLHLHMGAEDDLTPEHMEPLYRLIMQNVTEQLVADLPGHMATIAHIHNQDKS